MEKDRAWERAFVTHYVPIAWSLCSATEQVTDGHVPEQGGAFSIVAESLPRVP